MSSATDQLVLHIDADAFFVQVEQAKHARLRGRAVAIQQHQDIIAINDAARAAGVRKHMPPSQARELLRAVGGEVAHVHMEDDARVSYRPYRETSAEMMRVLKRFMNAAVVERASIDEAFVLCHPPGQGPGSGVVADVRVGVQLAASMREAVKRECGIVVSVGIARNKLVAKLASRLAKPDGMKAVDGDDATAAVLAATTVDRLPGFGGRVAGQLTAAGVTTAAQLQSWSRRRLQQELALKPEQAEKLWQYCRGIDPSPVQDRGPPKSLSIQMTLTPKPLPMHPSMRGAITACGGSSSSNGGMLQPLRVGDDDAAARMRLLLRAMSCDLTQRVTLDKEEHDRWPSTLLLTVRTYGEGAKNIVRNAGFPSASLLRHTASPPHTSNVADVSTQHAASANLPSNKKAATPFSSATDTRTLDQATGRQSESGAIGVKRKHAELDEAVVPTMDRDVGVSSPRCDGHAAIGTGDAVACHHSAADMAATAHRGDHDDITLTSHGGSGEVTTTSHDTGGDVGIAAVSAAVLSASEAMYREIASLNAPHLPVVQVTLGASAFVAAAAADTPTIASFFSRVAPQPPSKRSATSPHRHSAADSQNGALPSHQAIAAGQKPAVPSDIHRAAQQPLEAAQQFPKASVPPSPHVTRTTAVRPAADTVDADGTSHPLGTSGARVSHHAQNSAELTMPGHAADSKAQHCARANDIATADTNTCSGAVANPPPTTSLATQHQDLGLDDVARGTAVYAAAPCTRLNHNQQSRAAPLGTSMLHAACSSGHYAHRGGNGHSMKVDDDASQRGMSSTMALPVHGTAVQNDVQNGSSSRHATSVSKCGQKLRASALLMSLGDGSRSAADVIALLHGALSQDLQHQRNNQH